MKRSKREMSAEKATDDDDIMTSQECKVKKDKKGKDANKTKKSKKYSLDYDKSLLNSSTGSVGERIKKKRDGNTRSPKSPSNSPTNSLFESKVVQNSDSLITTVTKVKEEEKTKHDVEKLNRKNKSTVIKKRGRPLKCTSPPGKSANERLICESERTDNTTGKRNDRKSNDNLSLGNVEKLVKVCDDEYSLSQHTLASNSGRQLVPKTMTVPCPRLSARARLRSASPVEKCTNSTSKNVDTDETFSTLSTDTTDKQVKSDEVEPDTNVCDTAPQENKSIGEEAIEFNTTLESKSNDKGDGKQNNKKQKSRKEDISSDLCGKSSSSSSSNIEENLKILNISKENNSETVVVREENTSENVNSVGMQKEFPREKARYIPVNNLHEDYHGILLLTQHEVVAVHGCMQLALVLGDVDIGGYRAAEVEQDAEIIYVDVYSSNTSSLLYVKDQSTSPISSEEVQGKLATHLSTILNSTSEQLLKVLGDIENVSSCVIVKKLYSLVPAVLKKLDNFSGFPKRPKFLAQPFEVAVLDTEAWNVVVNEILTEMLKREDGCLCSVMLCGVGNVGKSSFARYVVNRMLAEHGAVYFLDCDCGQTEFTPPSCLSLVKITKPLLGPPFSHQLTPVASYFYGHISPGETPSEYIKLIGNLFHIYYTDYHCEGPLVINTQGWMQGLGLSLLVDCIRLTSPCHIVHINSPTEKRNVPIHLSDELLGEEKGWYYDSSYKCMKSGHGCTYHHLPVTEVQSQYSSLRKFKSRVSRDQCITSYFSSLYQPFLHHHMSQGKKYCDWIPPSMSLLMPYVVRWKDVALHIMHEKVTSDVMLFGFNLALVGLVHVDPELIKPEEDSDGLRLLMDQPVAEYIGFGIVRNIDPTNKLFYILTPVPKERLEQVNALVRGSAQLPTSYFLEDADSNRPYYCADYINVASKTASSRKPRYNLKRKPSKMKTSEHD